MSSTFSVRNSPQPILTTSSNVCVLSAKYVPQAANGLWACTCGSWNGSKVCLCCGATSNNVVDALNLPILSENMHSRLKAETAQREKAEQQKKQAVAIRKKKILLFSIIACLIVTAFVITTIVSGTNQRNNTFDDIEEFIANKQYEHAFDLVIASNLSQELKEQYIKNIKPQMQAQFEGEMEPQQVLNIDGFAIYTSRTTVYYLNESGDRVQLYKGSLIRGI